MNLKRFRLGRARGGNKSEKRRLARRNAATLDGFKPELLQAIFSTIPTGRLELNIEPYIEYIGKQIEEWDLVYKESWLNLSIVSNTTQQTTSDIAAKVLSIFQGLELTDPTIDDVVTELSTRPSLIHISQH
jgi:hypothetical protein